VFETLKSFREYRVRPRVGFVASGNLASDTVWLIWNHLRCNRGIDCHVFTDGFIIGDFTGFPRLQPLESLQRNPSIVDLVLLSIRSPGTEERDLLRRCHGAAVPTVLILADCGSGAQKFREQEQFVWPDYLCVADSLTHDLLAEAGAPPERLIGAGSPYLDRIAALAGGEGANASGIEGRTAYVCNVPNREDFLTWGRPVAYTEDDILAGINQTACLRPQWNFVVRPHPKQLRTTTMPKLVSDEFATRQPLTEVLRRYSICISSYSTALIVATTLGVPAVSYQPHPHVKIREALYRELGIPVVTTPSELAQILDAPPSPDVRRLAKILFNPGHSLEQIEAILFEVLTTRNRRLRTDVKYG
jgi:hypothetical protein